ncbi:MAG: Na/Pi symporter [Pseudomonadales bacterium]
MIGGMGLFLIGMKLLSDGLVAFAGENLRRALTHFTGTPCRAFISGALITALVQSSTATTVTLIGFVSAGLITFTQAIGVVIGASLGNTATGWVVAGLGLKINLGFYTLPLIGIGALLKLLGRRRWAELGLALAGFGMLFLV